MTIVLRAAAGAIAVLVAGCASAQVPEPREQFIRARDHGWLELEVDDTSIPSTSFTHPVEGVSYRRPEACGIRLLVDGEPVLDESVFPAGAGEPYSVESGFRIPVATGFRSVELEYSGCRASGQAINRVNLEVRSEMLTVLHFDGTTVESSEPIADPAHTIESIGRALEALPRGVAAQQADEADVE